VHGVSQWPNLRHLGEPKACWKQWVLRRRRKVWIEEDTDRLMKRWETYR